MLLFFGTLFIGAQFSYTHLDIYTSILQWCAMCLCADTNMCILFYAIANCAWDLISFVRRDISHKMLRSRCVIVVVGLLYCSFTVLLHTDFVRDLISY